MKFKHIGCRVRLGQYEGIRNEMAIHVMKLGRIIDDKIVTLVIRLDEGIELEWPKDAVELL